MSFDWENYIDLADDLKIKREISIKEAYHRCIVSRAYYGVFKLMHTFLLSEGFRPTGKYKKSIHEAVIRELENSGDPDRKLIASNLRSLRAKRVHADYSCSPEMKLKDAEFQIILAKEVAQNIKQLVP